MGQTIIKYACLAAGFIALGLGIIGIFVPLLPTTPFLLLASFCLVRSSSRMHHWLMHHPILGRYLTDYLEHKAIRPVARISALIFLWSALLVSIILVDHTVIRLVLAAVGIGVTIHLFCLKTIKPE